MGGLPSPVEAGWSEAANPGTLTSPMDVLLVERNPELRETFAVALAAAGYGVAIASDWELALRVAQEDTPAVVVLDASLEPGAAARFVNALHRDVTLRDVPVAGIAYHFGSERGIQEVGIQCCIPRLPTPAEVVKAVRWASDVYGEEAA